MHAGVEYMIQCIILSNLHLNYLLSGQNRQKGAEQAALSMQRLSSAHTVSF